MKFLELIVRNMVGRTRRTVLTGLTIAVATLVFAMLVAVPSSMDRITDAAAKNQRLFISNRAGPYNLPAKYCRDIEKMPHVTGCAADWDVYFTYRSDTDWFGVSAADPEIFDLSPDVSASPDTVARLRHDKRSAVLGAEVLKRYGWHVGQQITLRCQVNAVHFTMPFIIAAEVPTHNYPNLFLIRRDYFTDTIKALGQNGLDGIATRLIVGVDTADNLGQVARLIDETYHNSDNETRSQTESDFIASGLANIGNIRAIILSLVVVVMVTVLLIAGNSMAMTVRERIPEVALLRTLGFGQARIAYLLFGEAMLLGLIGGVLGAAGAIYLFAGGMDVGTITSGLALISISPAVALASVLMAIAVSLISGTLPIAGALKTAPAIALRKVV
ncbi:MAG TPA: ABC transporter permease [Candidatus Binataceae bacterium]|nr:ABC transporter permease [Candidatus Binataceae bacterium]